MNPELRRFLWLDLRSDRLIILWGLLVLVLFLIASTEDGTHPGNALAFAGKLTCYGLAIFVGCRAAADAVASEIMARTWDMQRMSPVSAWALTWGKLVGSTAFAWAGIVPCLLVMAFGATIAKPMALLPQTLVVVAGFAAMLALAMTVAFVTALQILRLDRQRRRIGTTIAFAAGALLLFVPALLAETVFDSTDQDRAWSERMGWYGIAIPVDLVVLASSLVFLGFALLGAWRLMRRELQLPNPLWSWLLFALWSAAWLAGFVKQTADLPVSTGEIEAVRVAVVMAVLAALSYALALSEPKDAVGVRRLVATARAGRWREVEALCPRWLPTAVLAVVVAAALMAVIPPERGAARLDPVITVASALCLFLRDLCLILAIGLGRGLRGSSLAVLALVVLYGLLPGVLSAAGGDGMLILFYPDQDGGVVQLVATSVMLALVGGFLVLRLRAVLAAPTERG